MVFTFFYKTDIVGVSVSKTILYGNSNLHLQYLYQQILKFEGDIYTYDKLVNKIIRERFKFFIVKLQTHYSNLKEGYTIDHTFN